MPSRVDSNFDAQGATGCPLTLSKNDVSVFSHALTAARGQFTEATRPLCQDHGLTLRAPWIIGMIGRAPRSPHELASFFNVGRSLITAELNQLTEAGLIAAARDANDGRRVTLSLTAKGKAVFNRLGDDLEAFITARLSGHSRDDIMRCAQILNDFAQGGPPA